MAVLPILAIVVGMAILVIGAEWLVRGASRLAAAAGISSLVIGLTVVAYGTSAPELAVSVGAALGGSGEVAIGNVVGSNVFNTLVILGLSALFGGLVVHWRLVRVDVPLLLAVTALVWWFASDGTIGVAEGAVLVAGVLAYSAAAYLMGRREPAAAGDTSAVEGADEAGAPAASAAASPRARSRWLRPLGLVGAGLVALVAGAQLLVGGATDLAAALGVSDLVIGLTVVAAGTSLPELATSVVASRRGERDIAVGNIVGSNLFNLLAVLGGSALAAGGLPVPDAAVATDLPVALLVTCIALPALALGLSVARWEGALLLAGYLGYTAYLVATATGGGSGGARAALLAGLAVLAVVVTVVGVLVDRRSARVQ